MRRSEPLKERELNSKQTAVLDSWGLEHITNMDQRELKFCFNTKGTTFGLGQLEVDKAKCSALFNLHILLTVCHMQSFLVFLKGQFRELPQMNKNNTKIVCSFSSRKMFYGVKL